MFVREARWLEVSGLAGFVSPGIQRSQGEPGDPRSRDSRLWDPTLRAGQRGDQAGRWRGGEAGPFVIAAVYSGKEDDGDKITFPRAWRSPSLRSGPPDSPRLPGSRLGRIQGVPSV